MYNGNSDFGTPRPMGMQSIYTSIAALALATTLWSWAAMAMAATVFSHHFPSAGTGEPMVWVVVGVKGLIAMGQAKAPSVAWPKSQAGYIPDLTTVLGCGIVVGAAGWSVYLSCKRYFIRFMSMAGKASKAWIAPPMQVQKMAPSRIRWLVGRRPSMRGISGLAKKIAYDRGLVLPSPVPGVYLGRDRRGACGGKWGQTCWSTWEDSLFVVGPPRSGKTETLVKQCAGQPGPLVSTSNKIDVLMATYKERLTRGKVFVVYPSDDGWTPPPGVESIAWNPIEGCLDAGVAEARGAGFAFATGLGGGGTSNGDFWRKEAEGAMRALLHAADVMGGSPELIQSWLSNPDSDQPLEAIMKSPVATQWYTELSAVFGTKAAEAQSEMRQGVLGTTRAAWRSLLSPAIWRTVTGQTGTRFNSSDFLLSGSGENLLYLITPEGREEGIAPYMAALIEDIIHTAMRRARTLTAERLDKPLGLWLDEAANIAPLPSLPGIMSTGASRGIVPIAVFQALSQVEDRWGREGARTIFSSSTIKIILPRVSDVPLLQDLTQLIGEIDDETFTISSGLQETGTQKSVRRLPGMAPSDIHGLASGKDWIEALIFSKVIQRPLLSRIEHTRVGLFRHLVTKQRRSKYGNDDNDTGGRGSGGGDGQVSGGPGAAPTPGSPWPLPEVPDTPQTRGASPIPVNAPGSRASANAAAHDMTNTGEVDNGGGALGWPELSGEDASKAFRIFGHGTLRGAGGSVGTDPSGPDDVVAFHQAVERRQDELAQSFALAGNDGTDFLIQPTRPASPIGPSSKGVADVDEEDEDPWAAYLAESWEP